MNLTIQKKSQKKTLKTEIVPLQHDNVQQETNGHHSKNHINI